MNYDKYDPDKCFVDFDAIGYLEEKYAFTNPEGRSYFMLNRNQAFMLLKSHKFSLTERKKKSISFLIEYYKRHKKFKDAPTKPVRIDVKNKQIVDGVTRLFVLLFQRKSQLVWIEYEL